MSSLAYLAETTETLSIVGSLAAGLYQLYLGYVFEGADGFSPILLMGWILGDICNVIGTFWTHQLAFQRVIALASMMNSLAMTAQHVYYLRKHRRIHVVPEPVAVGGNRYLAMKWSAILRPYILFTLVSAARAQPIATITTHEELSDWKFLTGQVMAWVAELSYALALVPQAVENFQRKSTGSVSIAIFLADCVSSLSYFSSILLIAGEKMHRSDSIEFLLEEMPYIMGTALCAILDFVLLGQYFVYPQFIVEVTIDDQAYLEPHSSRSLQPFRSWKSYSTFDRI